MFRSIMQDFEEDPFFRDHHRQMASLMGNFGDPFSRPFGFPALADPGQHSTRRPPSDDRQVAPTDMFSSMFANMNSMMANMQQNFHQMANDPNTYSFSSSSVMSYSSDGRSEPKYFQASKSTKKAPGGVRETQHAFRDSESGLHRMAIGHHLDDRSHIIEQAMNKKTGEQERKQDFINLDEVGAAAFDQEWKQRTRQSLGGLRDVHRDTRRALDDYTSRSTQNNRHAIHGALPRRDHSRVEREDARIPRSYREPDIRGLEVDHGAVRDRDWGRDDFGVQKPKELHNRVKKVRLNSRPTNKHIPRGGL